tara:strand:- start:384 stop:638 length:255 start_codon:yes stop_codon:yes gene_type:complete
MNFVPKKNQSAEKSANKLINQLCYRCGCCCYDYKVIKKISDYSVIMLELLEIDESEASYDVKGYLCKKCQPLFKVAGYNGVKLV